MYRYEREYIPRPETEEYYEREERARHWLQFILGSMTREKARALEAQGLPLGPYAGMAFEKRREIMTEWAPRLAVILSINRSETIPQLSPHLKWQIINTIRADLGLPPLPPL